jgi:hypothetical protein
MVLAMCVVGVSGLLVSVSDNSRVSDASLLAASRSQTNLEAVAAKALSDYTSVSGTSTNETIGTSHFTVANDTSATTVGHVSYVTRAPLQPSRDVAVVSIKTTTPGGGNVTLYRLVTCAEMIK